MYCVVDQTDGTFPPPSFREEQKTREVVAECIMYPSHRVVPEGMVVSACCRTRIELIST